MRSVEELEALGFQDWGGSWTRQEYEIDLTDTSLGLQLGAYASHEGWERLDVYVTHPSAAEPLWWTFDLAGYETASGGDVAVLDEDALAVVRAKIAEAVQGVLSQLA